MSRLVTNCDSKDKARWVLAAQACGLNLTEWVNDTLNDAALRIDFKPPRWMRFSDRVCQCLLNAGITRRDELIELIDSESWDWRAMPNFSSKCYAEVLEWRQKQ